MDNIMITLETLYDILRNEKKREDLQELEETFFTDVINYLKEKQTFLATKKDDDDLFASGEKDKLEYEIRSIKRILKEIYEKREKKILDIALNRSRTGSEIIDTSAMLHEEKEFYERILDILDKFRRGVLLNLFKGELPSLLELGKVCFDVDKKSEVKVATPDQKTITPPQTSTEQTPLKQETTPSQTSTEQTPLAPKQETTEQAPESTTETTEQTQDSTNTVLNEKENNEAETETTETKETPIEKEENKTETEEPKPELTKIKMIKPMPSFVWKDMKVYGPYEVNDEVEIFPEVAELMIRKGRAEKV